MWLWILLGLIVAGVVVALFLSRGEKVVEVEKIVEKEVIVRDTVFVQQVEQIEANFNAAQFEQGKADLNDDAKLALHDLAKEKLWLPFTADLHAMVASFSSTTVRSL